MTQSKGPNKVSSKERLSLQYKYAADIPDYDLGPGQLNLVGVLGETHSLNLDSQVYGLACAALRELRFWIFDIRYPMRAVLKKNMAARPFWRDYWLLHIGSN